MSSFVAFLPQIVKSGRSMPNILDDIIASVVENKIPAGRGTKLILKHEPLEEPKAERKKAVEESPKLYADIPHCWLYERRLLWLKDHHNNNNWKLFRECWRQGQVCETSPLNTESYIAFCSAGAVVLSKPILVQLRTFP